MIQNSYIASQELNRKTEQGRRQATLGWSAELTIIDGTLRSAPADAGRDTEYREARGVQVNEGASR